MPSIYLDPLYILTFAGEPTLWVVLSIALICVYLVVRNRWHEHHNFLKRLLAVLVPSLAMVLLIALFLKTAFPVARPCTPCTMIQESCNPYCPANDPSFPSAHAAVAFVAFPSLWLAWRKCRRVSGRALRWNALLNLPFLILPAAIAASRVALGVHTWADVITGSAIGIAAVWFVQREASRRVFRE